MIKIKIPKSFITRASWYGEGDGFHGKPNAGGGTFNANNANEIAHQFLPLGTPLKVKSVVTGKWINAVVRDRGPCKPERGIDLPVSAASKLGIKKLGVSEVLGIILPKTKKR